MPTPAERTAQMTDAQIIEVTAYMAQLATWNPGLVRLRSKFELSVQYQHMKIDEA